MIKKNDFEIRGETVAIFIERRDGLKLETLIDLKDFALVKSTRWSAIKDRLEKYYVVGRPVGGPGRGGPKTPMARFIMRVENEMVVDHISGDTLDNRRQNLRVVTHQENILNRHGPTKRNTSGFRGVSRVAGCKNSWQASINVKCVPHYLGCFKSKLEAANAVQRKLAEVGGIVHELA